MKGWTKGLNFEQSTRNFQPGSTWNLEAVESRTANRRPRTALFLVALADGFLDRLAGFVEGLFLVGGMEIKINPAQRAGALVLAQDDGDLAVERNAMP